MVFEAIAELVAERVEKDVSEITMESNFRDLGIDSLDTVELLMNLEDKLGIEIELDQKVETVGDLVALSDGLHNLIICLLKIFSCSTSLKSHTSKS